MSPSVLSRKQKDILNASKVLFWKHGIKRVTAEEICREAGVSKMTFYKYFPNKLEVAKRILEEEMNTSITSFNEIVRNKKPFSEKLEAIFMMKIKAVNNFSQEFLKDIYFNPDLGLKEYLDEKSAHFKDEVIKFYKNGQKQGHIRKEVNIDFIMTYSTEMTRLLENESLMAQYKTPTDFILEVMNLLFYGIVKK